MLKLMGISDLPCEDVQQDSLGIKKYIDGLATFMLNCPTPMSIALQGDWGTGKTSFLNFLQKRFQDDPTVKAIYFNTWQYSQFHMSGELYSSFLSSIIDQLAGDSKHGEEIKRKIFKVATGAVKQIVKNKIDIDIEALQNSVMETAHDRAVIIRDLKRDFQEVVEKTVQGAGGAEHGRVLIFIDDLDRLNPEVAVELLEVMKLFMDVRHCVFVLAIDYDVVVSGIRKKYGGNMSDEKCRSFFDKIIQLPFRMPVSTYRIEEMLGEVLGDELGKYKTNVVNILKRTLGPNPRTFKRLANFFILLKTVREQDLEAHENPQLGNSVLCISLIVQMYSDGAYQQLIDCESVEELQALLSEGEGAEQAAADEEEAKARETLRILSGELRSIQGAEPGCSIYERFLEALGLSSITSVRSPSAPSTRNAAQKIDRITALGREVRVQTAAEALAESYDIILEEQGGAADAYLATKPTVLTSDASRSNSMFRTKKQLRRQYQGEPLFIATSTGTALKMSAVTALCDYFQLGEGAVVWYDRGDEIYRYPG